MGTPDSGRYLTTKYGDRCLVLEPATVDKCFALVRREKDGAEFLVYYEDMARGSESAANASAFYGTVAMTPSGTWQRRTEARIGEMRARLLARSVAEVKPC
jgi:hypothetical protein